MPHKRNPITCERIAGLARLLRTNALAAMENVALWHERDISHSSVERVILPDSNILLFYMLKKSTRLIEKLLVYPENMKTNLERTNGLIYSQAVLLKLIEKGLTREDAYALVQTPAMQCWKTGESYRQTVRKDAEISKHLTETEIKQCFDLDHQLRNVDAIFRRAGLIE
jgi:adenylosuccinate lyase